MYATETYGGWSYRLNNILNVGKVEMSCQIQASAALLPCKKQTVCVPYG